MQKTGAPWTGKQNLTVVVTSGSGGTGFIALQLAKRAYGAATVVTATTGALIRFRGWGCVSARRRKTLPVSQWIGSARE